MSKVIYNVIPSHYLTEKTIFHINPCGAFVIGGPQVDITFYFLTLALRLAEWFFF